MVARAVGKVAAASLGLLLAFGAPGLRTLSVGARAEAPSAPISKPESGDVVLQNFTYADGEVSPSLRLHYLTLGTPKRDSAGNITNAVLLLHGTTGSANTLLQPGLRDNLFGPGQILDAARYYLIIPDGIGAGTSSKPSDGLRARFPHYGYNDQVHAQHEMLSRISVKHLSLVLGTSMGGMQTWLWGETYPDEMDALVAIASTPAAISGRNVLWRQMIIQAIRDDPDYRGGDYPADHPPHLWAETALPLFAIMTGNPERLEAAAPTRQAAAELIAKKVEGSRAFDPNDLLYVFASSADYDPRPRLGAIVAPMLAINFADDLLNPPELLNLPSGGNFDAVMLPGGASSYGHQSLAHAALWAPALQAFLAHVRGRQP